MDNAAKLLEELMQPEDEARNEHKRVQLRELAALNGTLKACPASLPCPNPRGQQHSLCAHEGVPGGVGVLLPEPAGPSSALCMDSHCFTHR